jgi:hypothetical protein
VLARLAEAEVRHIARVRGELAHRFALVPWQVAPPVGVDRLAQLSASHAGAAQATPA